MVDMGMTDKQFNGFVRFLLDALKDAIEEKESDKKDEKLTKIADKDIGRLKAPFISKQG